MIKTVQYNDLTEINIDLLYNKVDFLNELINFHTQGGNINYPVKRSEYDKLIAAEEFFRERFDNLTDMVTLIDKAGLINPFTWTVQDNKIIENPLYSKYWYRDNTDFYNNYAAQGFEVLLKNLIDNNIEPTSYEEIDTYIPSKINSKTDPLVYLANKLKQSKIYDILFTLMPQYKEIYKEEWIDKNLNHHILKDATTSMIFFKHGIIKEYLLEKDNNDQLHRIIQEAVYKNDIDFLQSYCSDINLFDLEQKNKIEGCFLIYSKTPEMTKYLIDRGCFVEGQFNGKYYTIIPSEYLTNIATIDTIFDYKPEYKKLIGKYYQKFYEHYFKSNSSELMNLLITKYDFPVEKVDMLAVGVHVYEQAGINWALKHGADPRNCEKFITNCVAHREDGLSLLKRIQKDGDMNIFYPDPLHYLLTSSPTKIFFNWLDKVSTEDITRYTKKGIPSWWAGITDINAYNFIIKKVENFNQLDENGNSWLFYMVNKITERTHNLKEILDVSFRKHIKKNPEDLLVATGTDKENNNILHLFFKLNDCDEKLIHKISNYSQLDLTKLLIAKNNDGLSPFDIALIPNNENPPKKYLDNKKIECLFILLDNAQLNFNYNIMINGQKAIEVFRNLFADNNEKVSKINNYYLTNLVEEQCNDVKNTKKLKI